MSGGKKERKWEPIEERKKGKKGRGGKKAKEINDRDLNDTKTSHTSGSVKASLTKNISCVHIRTAI